MLKNSFRTCRKNRLKRKGLHGYKTNTSKHDALCRAVWDCNNGNENNCTEKIIVLHMLRALKYELVPFSAKQQCEIVIIRFWQSPNPHKAPLSFHFPLVLSQKFCILPILHIVEDLEILIIVQIHILQRQFLWKNKASNLISKKTVHVLLCFGGEVISTLLCVTHVKMDVSIGAPPSFGLIYSLWDVSFYICQEPMSRSLQLPY